MFVPFVAFLDSTPSEAAKKDENQEELLNILVRARQELSAMEETQGNGDSRVSVSNLEFVLSSVLERNEMIHYTGSFFPGCRLPKVTYNGFKLLMSAESFLHLSNH